MPDSYPIPVGPSTLRLTWTRRRWILEIPGAGTYEPRDPIAQGITAAELVQGWADVAGRAWDARAAARAYCARWPEGPQIDYTSGEAEEFMGISQQHLNRLIGWMEIPAYPHGRAWALPRAAVEAYKPIRRRRRRTAA